MTLHTDIEYRCRKCGLRYVPFKPGSKCPLCGTPSEKTYTDFIDFFFKSAFYNLERYGFFTPIAWANISIGDRYLYSGFQLLQILHHEYIRQHILNILRNSGVREIKHSPSSREGFIELVERVHNEGECMNKAREILERSLEGVESEREKAVINHIATFLREICRELSRKYKVGNNQN